MERVTCDTGTLVTSALLLTVGIDEPPSGRPDPGEVAPARHPLIRENIDMIRRLPHRASRVALLAVATLGLTTLAQQTTSTQGGRQPTLLTRDSVEQALQRYGNRRNIGELQQFLQRGDIRRLPPLLKVRLLELAARPHTFMPSTAFSEADRPSQLFQYYLLDTLHFQANVFTATIPGINDGTEPTSANAANGGLPTIGSDRKSVV